MYYLYPKTNMTFFFRLTPTHLTTSSISPSFSHSLTALRQQIKSECMDTWETDAELICNPYIWIFTPLDKGPISKLSMVFPFGKPYSSGICFYEWVEIYHLMHIHWEENEIQTLHFGPHSFMISQAVSFLREYKVNDSIQFTTCEHDFPAFNAPKKDFISIECESDFSRCTLLNICVALTLQKKDGLLLLKVGSTTSELALDILCLLSHFYAKTYFIKPSITDVSKSDKFIVCKHFQCMNRFEYDYISSLYQGLPIDPERIFVDPIPLYFSLKLQEINSIFAQPQLEHIQVVLNQIQTGFKPDAKHYARINSQKCIDWCVKYKVPV